MPLLTPRVPIARALRAARPAPLTPTEEAARAAQVAVIGQLATLYRLHGCRHEWYQVESQATATAVVERLLAATDPALTASCLATVREALPALPVRRDAVVVAVEGWNKHARFTITAAWERAMAALPRAVQAAVWRDLGVQPTAPVLAMLARSIARGTRPAGDLAVIVASWTASAALFSEIHARWRRAWNDVLHAQPGVTVDDPALLAPWLQYAREVLTLPPATTKRARQHQQRWRAITITMLTEWESRAPAVAALLDDCVRADLTAGTEPLTAEAIGALPWLLGSDAPMPRTAEVLALLPRLPALPTAAQVAAQAACPKPVAVVRDFLTAVLTNRALAPVVGPALWAQHPASDTRVMLLTLGLADHGPWWHRPGFAADALAALAAVPNDVRPQVEELLYATLGHGPLDTWLQVLLTTDLVDVTNDYRGAELSYWLRAIDQVPDWHPTVDGLAAALRHPSLLLRQWAFAALTRATAATASPTTDGPGAEAPVASAGEDTASLPLRVVVAR